MTGGWKHSLIVSLLNNRGILYQQSDIEKMYIQNSQSDIEKVTRNDRYGSLGNLSSETVRQTLSKYFKQY